jgi:glycerophosphoryl diester phosphodiesterase
MMLTVYAHRGLHVKERENTVGAFAAAVELGVDGVELDVRRTGDGVLVVHHDATIGKLSIHGALQKDLPPYVPTLDEAMAACQGVLVNVEIKNERGRHEPTYDDSGDFARQVVTRLREIHWSERVIISSFDLATCAFVRSFDEEIRVGWLLRDGDIAGAMTQAHVLGFNALHTHFKTLSAELMVLAHELSLEVNTWTVNATRDIKQMLELGVNAIITDEPALVQALVHEASPEKRPPGMQ